jgi:hypothetical protein
MRRRRGRRSHQKGHSGFQFARNLAAADLVIVAGELARLQLPRFNAVVVKVMGPFMRQHEVERFSGVSARVGANGWAHDSAHVYSACCAALSQRSNGGLLHLHLRSGLSPQQTL